MRKGKNAEITVQRCRATAGDASQKPSTFSPPSCTLTGEIAHISTGLSTSRSPAQPRNRTTSSASLVDEVDLLYLAMPIDLVPDFIPVVGQLDDAIFVAAAVAYVARTAGRNVVEEMWPGSDRGLRIVLAITPQHATA